MYFIKYLFNTAAGFPVYLKWFVTLPLGLEAFCSENPRGTAQGPLFGRPYVLILFFLFKGARMCSNKVSVIDTLNNIYESTQTKIRYRCNYRFHISYTIFQLKWIIWSNSSSINTNNRSSMQWIYVLLNCLDAS